MKKNKFIKDPILNEIIIDRYEVIYELISCDEFIRLNDIKQLGVTWKVFPSAIHTRYSHSLGTYEIASRFMDAIEKNSNITLDYKDKELVSVAALLHDLGHGPYSHAFEKIFKKLDHEDWTKKIITDKSSKINQILTKYEIDIDELCSIYNHKAKKKWMSQIISSNFDADRIEYLLRDSYFVGTKYGTIDLPVFLNRVYLIDDVLAFSLSTVNMISSFLFARLHMTNDIYYNYNSFVYEWILKLIIGRIIEIYKSKKLNFIKYPFFNNFEWLFSRKELSINQFIKLTDSSFYQFILFFADWANDELLNSLVEGFKNGRNFSYSINNTEFNFSKENKYKIQKMDICFKVLYSLNDYDTIFFHDGKSNLIKFQETDQFVKKFSKMKKVKIVLLNNNLFK